MATGKQDEDLEADLVDYQETNVLLMREVRSSIETPVQSSFQPLPLLPPGAETRVRNTGLRSHTK